MMLSILFMQKSIGLKSIGRRISKQKVLSLDLFSAELERFWDETKQRVLHLSQINGLGYQKLIFKT